MHIVSSRAARLDSAAALENSNVYLLPPGLRLFGKANPFERLAAQVRSILTQRAASLVETEVLMFLLGLSEQVQATTRIGHSRTASRRLEVKIWRRVSA